MRIKRCLALLLSVALCICCLGCLNAESLEHYAYVLAIGFDKGELLPYRVTLLLQKTTSESDTQNSSGFVSTQAECRTLLECMETLSGGLPLRLDFARTNMLVISTDLLTQPNVVQNILDLPLTRLRIRYHLPLFAAIGKASDALDGLSNELDPDLSRTVLNIGNYSQKTGLVPSLFLSTIQEALKGQAFDVTLPLCGVTSDQVMRLQTRDSVGNREYAYIGGSLAIQSDMKTSLSGAALLKNGQMVGYLDGQNVQLLLMATGKFTEGRRQIPGPGGKLLSVYLRAEKKPKTTFSLTGNAARANVTIPLLMFVELPQTGGIGTDDTIIRFAEQSLTADTEALFACCRRLGCDAMGFGKQAVQSFHSGEAWEAFDWRAAYAGLEASFTYEIRLLHGVNKSELE